MSDQAGLPEGAAAKVYAIAAGEPFVDVLAAELLRRHGGAPLDLSRVTVLLPTRRALRALREAFLRSGDGAPMILPVMRALGDVEADDLGLEALGQEARGAGADLLDLPPAIAPLKRRLLLTRLILRAAGAQSPPDAAQAARLAEELAHLLDQVQTERLSFTALADLVPEDYAAHWQTTLNFLTIVTEHWPAVLQAEACLDPAQRRNLLLEAQAALWRDAPPADAVIAAGSTGSIPATADLLGVVARLPAGAVILPGLDQHMDDASWDVLDPAHPQFGMKQLLARIGIERDAVRPWPSPLSASVPTGRALVLSAALRPAAAAAGWPPRVLPSTDALAGLGVIESPGPREEAGAIALLMREALEKPVRTAALVTPDRDLARRVAAELRRWDIDIDDSAGQPLSRTPPGTFLRLTAALAVEQVAPVALLSCLKHPLAAGGLAAPAFRRRVRELEVAVLRGPRPAPGFEGIAAALAEAKGEVPHLLPWLEGLARTFAPFAAAIAKPRASPTALISAHAAFAEELAASDDKSGAGRLWAGEAGEMAAQFLAELLEAAPLLPVLHGPSYLAFFETLMRDQVVRPRYGRHPRLHIWGPLEARLQRADLLILGGLNEGTWPPEPAADPWMSRPMRQAFGLPAPERRIGLAAHDFVQAAVAPRVVLSRSTRVEGTPTVPSRWLLRLKTYLAAADQPWPAEGSATLAQWCELLDRPGEEIRIVRPAPAPPLAARPRQLSVTQVETWMRDPYAIYARHVLGLKALDPLEADPGAAERGTLIHRALDRFVRETADGLPDDAFERLLAVGEEVFTAERIHPGILAFWWPRFVRIARWFVDVEGVRRATARPLGSEIRGRMMLEGPAGAFTLTAMADRLDELADGSLGLIDYKTGALPQKRDVEWGFAPQLPLEAVIAGAGGFGDVAAGPVNELAYWRLSGGEPPGEMWSPTQDCARLTAEARKGLERLIAAFDDPATPYLAIPRPKYAPRYNDYDHLARVAEWAEFAPGEAP